MDQSTTLSLFLLTHETLYKLPRYAVSSCSNIDFLLTREMKQVILHYDLFSP
jgi:hypothetical protein